MDIQSKESLSIHLSIHPSEQNLKLIHYRFLMYSISDWVIFDNAIQESRHKCGADIFQKNKKNNRDKIKGFPLSFFPLVGRPYLVLHS
jgi:hypothetical protein